MNLRVGHLSWLYRLIKLRDGAPMKWPNFFPENCPPGDSRPSSGVFYRVILDYESSAINAKHFRSHRQSQPRRIWPPDIRECDLCSISVLQTLEESIKLTNLLLDSVPANSRKIGRVARGSLDPTMGKIKLTPDERNNLQSHHNWWLSEEIDPAPSFECLDILVTRS